jgi:hypothetical protein
MKKITNKNKPPLKTDGVQGLTLIDTPIQLEAIEKGFKITSKYHYLMITTTGPIIPPEFLKEVVNMLKDVYKEGFQEAANILMNKEFDKIKK